MMNYQLVLKIILLTGTPIMDKPVELALEMNLILPKGLLFDIKNFYKNYIEIDTVEDTETGTMETYKLINTDDFMFRLYGYVGFYQGLGTIGFAKVTKHFVEVKMSDYQAELYKIIELTERGSSTHNLVLGKVPPNNVKLGTRQTSNVIFPNNQIGQKGHGLTNDILSDIKLVKTFCPKAWEVVKILKANKFPAFVNSFFLKSGVEVISQVLNLHGFQQIVWDKKQKKLLIPDNKQPKFILLTSEDKILRKIAIDLYNNPLNKYGDLLSVIVGSNVLAMGFSLKRTRIVILYEPSWDWPLMEQIQQRGERFCGHVDLPPRERTLDIYYLQAVLTDKQKDGEDIRSVDEYMYALSDVKINLANQFRDLIWRSSIDCDLLKVANEKVLGKKVNCYSPPKKKMELIPPVEEKIKIHRISRQTTVRFERNTTQPIQEDLEKIVVWLQYVLTVKSDNMIQTMHKTGKNAAEILTKYGATLLRGDEVVIHGFATHQEIQKVSIFSYG